MLGRSWLEFERYPVGARGSTPKATTVNVKRFIYGFKERDFAIHQTTTPIHRTRLVYHLWRDVGRALSSLSILPSANVAGDGKAEVAEEIRCGAGELCVFEGDAVRAAVFEEE